MFCPCCGSLSYTDSKGWTKCSDYGCGYEGPVSGDDGRGATFVDPMTGDTFDISRLVATTDATDLSRHDGPVGEPYPHFSLATGVQGVACTECDSTNTIANSSMRRAASRDHTQHYQCKDCSHKWFER